MSRRREVIYRHFSPETNRLYLLVRAPGDRVNLEICGVQMKSAGPDIDTVLQASLRHLRPLEGVCLDTCAGLGYSAMAMAAASAVRRVVAFEVDPNVVEAARQNPDSARLFTHPKIELREADVTEALPDFPAATFDRVFHDPPRVSLAGELYSEAFYRELYRVMKPGGRLFHYTGAPGEKAGKRTVQGVLRRLASAGFRNLRQDAAAQGVAGLK